MNKLLITGALTSALILTGCGSSSSDVANDVVNNATATVSGTITDESNTTTPNAPLTGVKVECIYTGSLPCSSSTTDASGNYSVTLLNNTDFYLRATLSSYITINSAVMTVSADDSGNDIGLLNTGDVEGMLDIAFSTTGLTMSSAAWLAVDVVDASGNRIAGKVVNGSVGADTAVYPDCATAAPGAASTTPCTPPNDFAPAYMAKYSTTGEITVTALGQTQRGFLVNGEVLYMEFSQ